MKRIVSLLLCVLWNAAVAAEPPSCRPKALCERASREVERLLRESGAPGATVIVDVHSGAVIAFASTTPEIGLTTPLKPLSLTKLFIGEQWWQHCGNKCDEDAAVRSMIANSRDLPGRQIAEELRARVGAGVLLHELARDGIPTAGENPEYPVFADVSPQFADMVQEVRPLSSLSQQTSAEEWGKAFSIGESGFTVTLLQLASYMQAIGAGGRYWPLILRDEKARAKGTATGPFFTMEGSTARKLQQAMKLTVTEGTAQSIRNTLKNGWTIGGKTGTRFEGDQPAESIFGGMAWDNKGKARYAFVTYLRHAGRGGEKAAQVSAQAINAVMHMEDHSLEQTQVRGYWVDPDTGLMWAGKDNGKDVTWKQAVKYCRDLRLAGYSDWRLASLPELEEIYDATEEASGLAGYAKKLRPFSWHVKGNLFLTGDDWTSPQGHDDRGKPNGYAWRFDFNQGQAYDGDELYFHGGKRALCVRGERRNVPYWSPVGIRTVSIGSDTHR
jgi:hypothetical protein